MKNDKRPSDEGREERSSSMNDRKGYDPYQRDPGAGKIDDDRVDEAEEREAQQREGVHMRATERLDDSTTAPLVHTGIPGQTTQGSYGFNDATGQGEYMDRTRDGGADVGVDPVHHASDHLGTNDDLGDPDVNEEDRTDR